MAFDYTPPKYAQVVAEIKRRIEVGDYLPGSLLPSEHQLVADFGVSRPTIVKSLSALRQEGWIETQQGRGSFVRGRPALDGAERTRPGNDVLELAETELSGELVQAGVKVAPPHVITLLGLKAGAKAFLRQRVLSHDGEPVELASVWLPLDLAAGTDLASPDLLNESIRHHLRARKRVRFDHAVERITARHPTGEESTLLQVAGDAPVLGMIIAVYDAAKTPLQVVELVLPGERHELHDAYPFT
ncbi:MAG TPA: GntR family transcriptional regulator [Streptosporangiaceae bacterium]|nr:GntR family transcriptional regulator [Streptosporangiaceae bacterium]